MRWLSKLWRKIRKFFGRKSKRKEKDVNFGLEVFDENRKPVITITDKTAILGSVDNITRSMSSGQSAVYDYSSKGSQAVVLKFAVTSVSPGEVAIQVTVAGARVTVSSSGYALFTFSMTTGVLL